MVEDYSNRIKLFLKGVRISKRVENRINPIYM